MLDGLWSHEPPIDLGHRCKVLTDLLVAESRSPKTCAASFRVRTKSLSLIGSAEIGHHR